MPLLLNEDLSPADEVASDFDMELERGVFVLYCSWAFFTVTFVWSLNSIPPGLSVRYPGHGTPCVLHRLQPGRPSSHLILRFLHVAQPAERIGIVAHHVLYSGSVLVLEIDCEVESHRPRLRGVWCTPPWHQGSRSFPVTLSARCGEPILGVVRHSIA